MLSARFYCQMFSNGVRNFDCLATCCIVVGQELKGITNNCDCPPPLLSLSLSCAYNTDLKFKKFSCQQKIDVWMDIHKMAEGEESTTQTMAEAVEGAVVFLMCVSESYKYSQYCRQGQNPSLRNCS